MKFDQNLWCFVKFQISLWYFNSKVHAPQKRVCNRTRNGNDLKITRVRKSTEYFLATPLFKRKCAEPPFSRKFSIPGSNYSLDCVMRLPIQLTLFTQPITCSPIQSFQYISLICSRIQSHAHSFDHFMYCNHIFICFL